MSIKTELARLHDLETICRAIVAEMVTETDGRLSCLWCETYNADTHKSGCEMAELVRLVKPEQP